MGKAYLIESEDGSWKTLPAEVKASAKASFNRAYTLDKKKYVELVIINKAPEQIGFDDAVVRLCKDSKTAEEKLIELHKLEVLNKGINLRLPNSYNNPLDIGRAFCLKRFRVEASDKKQISSYICATESVVSLQGSLGLWRLKYDLNATTKKIIPSNPNERYDVNANLQWLRSVPRDVKEWFGMALGRHIAHEVWHQIWSQEIQIRNMLPNSAKSNTDNPTSGAYWGVPHLCNENYIGIECESGGSRWWKKDNNVGFSANGENWIKKAIPALKIMWEKAKLLRIKR